MADGRRTGTARPERRVRTSPDVTPDVGIVVAQVVVIDALRELRSHSEALLALVEIPRRLPWASLRAVPRPSTPVLNFCRRVGQHG